ncbi:MAG: periplasmic heavy metal sensor [Verrucomicrobiae bacterium]|nr:periplasmic heavy metal sensor [Verrucomicrobiae bacterium]
MSSRSKTILLLLTVGMVAIIGCAVGTTIVLRMREAGSPVFHSHQPGDHSELHSKLRLTQEQHGPMEAIESRFAALEKALIADIRNSNTDLASALKRDRAFSKDVQAAVEEIHRAQAALQKATIEHLVEMGTVLTPEQFQQLIDQTGTDLTRE